MGNKSVVRVAAMLATLPFCVSSIAEQHTSESLEHAAKAANSVGDSKAVREHAAEALKHIEAAKAAQASNPGIVKQLSKGEADLKSAVKNASQFNTDTATRDAMDAKTHLNAADTAARRLEAIMTQPKPAKK